MRHLYPLLLLLATVGAQAQNFRPFRPRLIYQLSEAGTPGDTTHLLRLESGSRSGADSVYTFSTRAAARRATGPSCGSVVIRSDNWFGKQLLVRAGAEYVLRTAGGATFTLKPRHPLNQPWAATATLTARVTARGLGSVLGLPDSVVTISLSDGQQLRIGKHYGWAEGPALGSYLNPRLPRRPLTLTGLPELGNGSAGPGGFAVYDFQPGDVFLHYSNNNSCTEAWQRDSVVSRRLSANGDTLVYRIWTRSLTIGRGYTYPTPPPAGVCTTVGTVLSAGALTTLRVLRRDGAELTGAWAASNLVLPLARTADYGRRHLYRTGPYSACGPIRPDSVALYPGLIDSNEWKRYGLGLGLVYSYYAGWSAVYTTTLLGYRKVLLPTSTGVETWGSLRSFGSILKAADHRPAASTAAFPNPFAQELTVRFETQRPQRAAARLYNALGQLVQQRELPVSAGAAELRLALPALPAGLYSLHLRHDGRTEVLKVVRE